MSKKVRKPPSAFILYVRDVSKDFDKKMCFQDILPLISKQWKNLEITRKSFYINKAKELTEEYNKQHPIEKKKYKRTKKIKINTKLEFNSEDTEKLNQLKELFMPKIGNKIKARDQFTILQYNMDMHITPKINSKTDKSKTKTAEIQPSTK